MRTIRKKTMILNLFAVMFSFAALVLGCGKTDKDKTQIDKQNIEKQTTEQPKTIIDTTKFVKDGKYFCVMHPTMQSNEPAKCPTCKMDLMLKSDYNKEMDAMHEELEGKFAGKKNSIHFEVNFSEIKSSDCGKLIIAAVKSDTGVLGYHIDILNRVVHMYLDKTKTTKANVEKLITDAGFDANYKKANPESVAKLSADCK
jgi:hypothetical protein